MIKRFLKLILLLFALPLISFGQEEIQYSQYMFNGLIVNPAYAGYKENINISLLHRSQWVGIKGAPNTQSLIIDGAFGENKTVGLGLSLVNDKAGIQRQTSAMFNYSYRMPISGTSRLNFGIGAGVVQFLLRGDQAFIASPDDPSFTGGSQTYFSPDARIGVFFENERFYAGLSANNLLTRALNKNNKKANFVALPETHLFLTAGGIMDVNNGIKFKPSLMLRDNPQGMGNIDFNASFLINDTFWIGGSYRMGVDMWKKTNNINKIFQQNSLVGLVEVYLAKGIRIGYAFDYSLSNLSTYSNGSHEFSLGFIINSKNRYENALTTPRYF